MAPRRKMPLLPLALVLAGGLVPAQAATVHVERRGGRVEEVDDILVTKDSFTGVEGRRGPARLTWDAHQVVRIDWRIAPQSYREGLRAFRNGDYGNAVPSLQEALGSAGAGGYEWLPKYVNYYLGRALARTGQYDGALQALQALIEADPRHRFVPDAYARIADIHLENPQGADPAAAREALERLQRITQGLDAGYGIRAELGLARVDIMTGNAAKALNTLDGLASRARSDEKLQHLIALERGRAHVALKQYEQAEGFFKSILDGEDAPAEVIARAANGLGDSQFEQDKYGEALWSYSRTYALFIDRASLKPEVAWALFRGGLAFRRHAGTLEGDEASEMKSRGTGLLHRARRDFPETRGGYLAREELGLAN